MTYDTYKPHIDAAVKFTKQYPAPLRPAILSYVLGSGARGRAMAPTFDATVAGPGVVTINGVADASLPEAAVSLAITAIAAEAGVSEAAVRQVFSFEPSGSIVVRPLLREDSMARRQVGYSVLYLVAKDALGQQTATSEELRVMCKAKKSFNSPNFTRNFKTSDFVKGYSGSGAEMEWGLTVAGRAEAFKLIRELVGPNGDDGDAAALSTNG